MRSSNSTNQQQIDAQKRMLAHSAEFMGPLVAPLDEAMAKLALPPHTGPMHPSRRRKLYQLKRLDAGSEIRRSRAAIDGTNDDYGSGAGR